MKGPKGRREIEMSVKNNAFVGVAAAALGVTIADGTSPICEGLLNDVEIRAIGIVEIDKTGRALMVATTNNNGADLPRPVADSNGDVRLYANASAAYGVAKRSNLPAETSVEIIAFDAPGSVGDPVKALIASHKAYVKEKASATTRAGAIAAKITAAAALGWDTASGTPEADEYADYLARQTSIGEWLAFCTAKVTALTASLTAAGIDPVTYQATTGG